MEFLEINSKNIYTSLLDMANFIRSRKVVNSKANDVPEIQGYGKAAWNFVFSIYKSEWNSLSTNKYNNFLEPKFQTNLHQKFWKIAQVQLEVNLRTK